jgi:hypothetical protein
MAWLTRHHLRGCPEYGRIWPGWHGADSVEELPYLHVGLFKLLELKTEGSGIQHQRTLNSSSTSGTGASRIVMDSLSARLQGESSIAILKDFVGPELRPLIVLDAPRSLRSAAMSARIAAAMSLRPLATDMRLVLGEAADPASVNWQHVLDAAAQSDALLVYGFTYLLWQAWAELPEEVKAVLATKKIHFVHSGGWKKLENEKVGLAEYEARLLEFAAPGSAVVDFYGLVEQVGIVYPQCREGYRHVPVWAGAIVRDPWTLEPLVNQPGQLQLMNAITWGAPYHNVLTEDLARMVPGECPCGRSGPRFELLGRMPKAELRGCSNV